MCEADNALAPPLSRPFTTKQKIIDMRDGQGLLYGWYGRCLTEGEAISHPLTSQN